MSKEDLIPFGKPGNEEQDAAIRAKTKGSASDKRKFAMKLNAIKRGAVNPENIDAKLLALVTDPKASALQLQEITNLMITRGIVTSKLADFIAVVRAAADTHSKIHGTKSFIDAKFETNFDKMTKKFDEYKDELVFDEEKKDDE